MCVEDPGCVCMHHAVWPLDDSTFGHARCHRSSSTAPAPTFRVIRLYCVSRFPLCSLWDTEAV